MKSRSQVGKGVRGAGQGFERGHLKKATVDLIGYTGFGGSRRGQECPRHKPVPQLRYRFRVSCRMELWRCRQVWVARLLFMLFLALFFSLSASASVT